MTMLLRPAPLPGIDDPAPRPPPARRPRRSPVEYRQCEATAVGTEHRCRSRYGRASIVESRSINWTTTMCLCGTHRAYITRHYDATITTSRAKLSPRVDG